MVTRTTNVTIAVISEVQQVLSMVDLAHSDGQGQGYADFDYEIVTDWADATIAIR